MSISPEMRRLSAKWKANTGWPKRLESIAIKGLRGWTGQRFQFGFPIMAVTGENGVGKSTVLQCAAAVYASEEEHYASDFFPDTAWDEIRNATVSYVVREGTKETTGTIRKPGPRWRGNPDRRERDVRYIDLSRIQPVSARTGYMMLADPALKEVHSTSFEQAKLSRLCEIMGRHYESARMAATSANDKRHVPVIAASGVGYSGFHQGAGETTVAELLESDIPPYSIVLIDEIETSLHPRAQGRLIRDLADRCRERELQVVLTTHSPYVLEELPFDARAYIMQSPNGTREVIYGVSSEFAMSKMDDVQHHECDVYVEDRRAEIMLIEIVQAHKKELVGRFDTIPYGASSVGQSLGQMVAGRRFKRASCVFIDGDQGDAMGCNTLPGVDPPERVVFSGLKERGWIGIAQRTGRSHPEIVDACTRAMAAADHHEWVNHAAAALVLGGDVLWNALCAEWAVSCLTGDMAAKVIQPIEDAINNILPAERSPWRQADSAPAATILPPNAESPRSPDVAVAPRRPSSSASPSGQTNLLELFSDAEQRSKP